MTVSRLRFAADNNGTYYIDLNAGLSLQERRMHRQKKIVTVYGGFFVDAQGHRLEINTAPMNWVIKAAVNLGFKQWRKMISQTLRNSEATGSGKYSDFKVYLDNSHRSGNTLLPVDAQGNDLYDNPVEWDYSTLFSEDSQGVDVNGYELMIVGNGHSGSAPNWNSVSLVKSWFDTRPTPHSPTPNDIPDVNDPLANLFDDGDMDDERLANISSEGDQPPYDENVTFGNAQGAGNSNNLQRVSVAEPAGGGVPVAPVHGFQALCGLLQIVVGTDTSSNSWELILDVETNGESF